MAKKEASFGISIDADLSDFKKTIQSIPGITKKEVTKFVSDLSRQMKQTEKIGKKVVESNKKAIRESAKAAKQGAKDYDLLASSAKNAGKNLEKIADTSGDVDRGFTGIGQALRTINPELAEMADGMADAFSVTESLTLGFGALNPMVLGATVAIGALVLGYGYYSAELEKANELILEQRDAQKELSLSAATQAEIMSSAAAELGVYEDKLRSLDGVTAGTAFEIRGIRAAANKEFQSYIDATDVNIKQLEDTLSFSKAIELNSRSLGASAVVLSDEQSKTLRLYQLQNDSLDNNLDLLGRGTDEMFATAELVRLVNLDLAEMKENRESIVDLQGQAVDAATDIFYTEGLIAEQKQIQADALDDANDANERALDLAQQLAEEQAKATEQIEAQLTLDRSLFMLRATEEEKQITKINERYNTEFDRLRELAELTGDIDTLRAIAFETQKVQQEELSNIKLEAEQKARSESLKTSKAELGAVAGLYTALGDATMALAGDNKKAQQQAFLLNRSLAISGVAFKTAEAMAAAQILPPPLNIIQTGTAIATGVAQGAAVLAQKPPKYHTGGMVQGERNITALNGEGVLSQAATRRIGGEEGLNRIERGEAREQTIIARLSIGHLGLFSKQIGIEPIKVTGIKRY